MGVKRRTLTLSYVAVPVIVTFVSGVIGTLIAVLTPAGIEAQLADSLNYYSMPAIEVEITPFILIYGLVVPPVTAFIVNVLVIRKRLKKTPLALLRNEKKAVRKGLPPLRDSPSHLWHVNSIFSYSDCDTCRPVRS